jgi:NTP pyrophosphatase (non-canonical NTP hydrolase)
MFSNVERFAMRGLKGIRKGDYEKTKINLLIATSWFTSVLNRLQINLDDVLWRRFPYACSYCGTCPCSCKEKRIKTRQRIVADESKRPRTLNEFQDMFEQIYPHEKRTLEHAGVHLAEELGEFSEAILTYRGRHNDSEFENISEEAADLFSCIISVFNSLQINMAKEISIMFSDNCHACNKAPCECSFEKITKFGS